MNTSNVRPETPLSEILSSAARHATSPPSTGFLQACAIRAREMEDPDPLVSDVTAFHRKFDHPAPMEVADVFPDEDVIGFRIRLIREETEELVEALCQRSLAKVAAEACDLIYVVVGTLVILGLPMMPFWRDIQRANMGKEKSPDGGKPIKPEGWEGPNPTKVLYEVKRGEA